MFKKILIANRGEIAVRVIRACREMGIAPVAVYSEADREALHVRMADEAFLIGPPPAAESYLSSERILAAAKASGAAAIHPGYGFLSENPLFPEACERAGIVFIGPGAAAMRLMGHKVAARQAMVAAGVPVVPGTEVLPEDPAAARAEAERVIQAGMSASAPDLASGKKDVPAGGAGGGGLSGAGVSAGAPQGPSAGPRFSSRAAGSECHVYPILLKAAAGGGGKGMRVVAAADEFASAFTQARSEARASFGDPSVYAEKYVTRPRHIEVQILADTQGTILHLGERECTIQRRHQKLVEESPSPVVDAATRARLGEMAVKAARAAGYVGAGTCEFLRDAGGAFFFMEMNARLQVEHPVTEMVTGRDLVKLQILIAAGEKMPFSQAEVVLSGWAIECRIFAEDPARNFLPSPGRIGTLRIPAGPGIRDDGGVYQGYRVPIHYDPMISKLIAWGGSRAEALARMRRALDEYRIEGVRTTIPFHQRLVRHPAFLAGDMDTSFIETHRSALTTLAGAGDPAAAPAAPAAAEPADGPARRAGPRRPSAKGGRALTGPEVAVIAAAITARRRWQEAAEGAWAMGPYAGQERRGRTFAPLLGGIRAIPDGAVPGGREGAADRRGGWKIAGRLGALRDR